MLVTAPRSTWIQDGSGRPSPCAHRVDRSPSTASAGVFGCEYDDAVTGLPLAGGRAGEPRLRARGLCDLVGAVEEGVAGDADVVAGGRPADVHDARQEHV